MVWVIYPLVLLLNGWTYAYIEQNTAMLKG